MNVISWLKKLNKKPEPCQCDVCNGIYYSPHIIANTNNKLILWKTPDGRTHHRLILEVKNDRT